MQVYHTLEELPSFENAVITIGSFDGVHVGHQQIIQRIRTRAQEIKGQSIVISFHPHPRIVLNPEHHGLELISSNEEKAAYLADYGVDVLVLVPFSKAFASQSPEEYIRNFLVQYFQPKVIVIGYDHRFGQKRAGDINYLKNCSSQYGFEVEEISKQEIANMAVSSTKVRKAIARGAVEHAQQLLNHPYRLTGRVVHGLKIGTEIGYPTANIKVETAFKLVPPVAIYAVLVHHKDQSYKAMLYIGNRPTVADGLEKTIEVNIFNFHEKVYDENLQIDFIKYLRADQKFENLEQLSQQLAKDKEATLIALENYSL